MSSSEDEEDFASFGTPLDPIEEDEVFRKRPRTVEDQIAKDKYGRRRFHGAFTGGFSAGYFNSVGSREGWKPSTFKSSRSSKAHSSTQKPEDFMDDEDMDEFGIAPKVIKLKDTYDDTIRREKRKFVQSEGPIPGQPVLHSLLEPVRSTVGVQILKKMGWKVGQGIGPRLSKTQKKKQSKLNTGTKIYGCFLPDAQTRSSDHESSGEDSAAEEEITFAPDDYDLYIVKPKDNCFGIGYSGLDRRTILSGHINLFDTTFTVKEKSKKFSIKGQGFGVGALEDDDEDIYSKEDMSQYDFSLEKKESSTKKPLKQFPAISGPNEPIDGFIAAQTPVRKKVFPPPKIPPDFQPIHSVKKSRFEPVQSTSNERKTTKSAYHRHDLTANERGIVLDEPLPSAEPKNTDSELKTKSIKQAFGSTFKPFIANPDKQRRYEQYLKLVKNGQKDKLSILQPMSMTEWERERERVEFEQAERLYKPLSLEFSDRFVTASQPDDATNPLAEVQKTLDDQNDMKEAAKKKMFGKLTRKYMDWTPASLLCKRFNIPEPLNGGSQNRTRNNTEKRPKFSVFNFLEAASYNTFSSQNKDNEVSSEPVRLENRNTEECEKESVDYDKEAPKEIKDCELSGKKDEDVKIKSSTKDLDDLTNKEDLYKAIFLSSSDESDNEEKTEIIDDATTNESAQKSANTTSKPYLSNTETSASKAVYQPQQEIALKNALRNTSPPRGIFANLDLDAINARRTEKGQSSNTEKVDSEPREIKKEKLEGDDVMLYGPKLPTILPQKKETTKIVSNTKSDSSDSDDEWIECSSDASKHKNKKKQKKYHHKEHKKYKSHHKHKKHKHKKA